MQRKVNVEIKLLLYDLPPFLVFFNDNIFLPVFRRSCPWRYRVLISGGCLCL